MSDDGEGPSAPTRLSTKSTDMFLQTMRLYRTTEEHAAQVELAKNQAELLARQVSLESGQAGLARGNARAVEFRITGFVLWAISVTFAVLYFATAHKPAAWIFAVSAGSAAIMGALLMNTASKLHRDAAEAFLSEDSPQRDSRSE